MINIIVFTKKSEFMLIFFQYLYFFLNFYVKMK